MHFLGETRSSFERDHLLQTPDTFVRAPLPGMRGATAIVHTGPAIGARFAAYTAELEHGGTLGPTDAQRFVYVLKGALTLVVNSSGHSLKTSSFAFLPQGTPHAFNCDSAATLFVVEKPYQVCGGVSAPRVLIGDEESVESQALLGDSDLQVKALLPNDFMFDFAVNTMMYQPGAALSMVEVHVMEHGLLMLEGGGIYRLGNRWYPVQAGDYIWMGAYCPQWFGALGKTPAKYLIYKDWNRHPLLRSS